MSSAIDSLIALWYVPRLTIGRQMATKTSKGDHDDSAAIHIRAVPRQTFYRLKMAAAAEQTTVRELLIRMIEEKLQDLEKKGLLPKGKG